MYESVFIYAVYIFGLQKPQKEKIFQYLAPKLSCFHITHTFPCTSFYSHTPSDALHILVSQNKELGEVTKRALLQSQSGQPFPTSAPPVSWAQDSTACRFCTQPCPSPTDLHPF